MADELKNENLKDIFEDNESKLMNQVLFQDSGGPETGAEKYNKFGVYCDTAGKMAFLWVVMERDDPAANPDGPWSEDDYLPRSAARYGFSSRTWKAEPGNMNLISSQSFSFLDDKKQFFNLWREHRDRLNAGAAALPVSSGMRFDESQP